MILTLSHNHGFMVKMASSLKGKFYWRYTHQLTKATRFTEFHAMLTPQKSSSLFQL